MSPVAIAVDVQDIDTTKNYMIVKVGSSTDIDFDVLYDSQGRNIYYIKDNHRMINMLFKFTGFNGDPLGAYNKYVLYTDDKEIINGNILLVNRYKIRILYPIEKEFGNLSFQKDLF